MKRLKTILLTAAIALMLMACGSPKYMGSWKLTAVNDLSIADYIAQFNLNIDDFEANYFDMNLEVAKNTVTVTTPKESSTLDIVPKSDGFETTQNGEVAFSVAYNEEIDTLSYTVNLGAEGRVTYTYSRK